ncbi:hypothetical protein P691DRAFT_806006 [Macrolepiota fuliginosa MF-IS2]|uniref:Uncharacterized protein n=1 Tax=Macrolepiota fuliginosa MF-IS2 TaxID=1400762 RepID=A0A9P5X8Q7_9AGAR|nr:hypothetical protein P691DRAFT_806006 [Macrolepiota fuliginosa MF-IS2]
MDPQHQSFFELDGDGIILFLTALVSTIVGEMYGYRNTTTSPQPRTLDSGSWVEVDGHEAEIRVAS